MGARYQPQGLTRISDASLGKKVLFLWNGATPDRNIKASAPSFSIIGGNDVLIGSGPFGKKISGGANRGRRFAAPDASSGYTVFALIQDGSGRGAYRNPFDGDAGGANRIFQLRLNPSNQAEFLPFNTGGTPIGVTSSNASSVTGLTLIVASVDASGNVAIWMNNVAGGTGALSGAPRSMTSTLTLSVGNLNDSGATAAQPFGGDVYLCGVLGGWLSESERRDLYENPWQLLEIPDDDEVFVVSNPGITPITGTLTITGYAPTVSQTSNQTVVAGVGSLTITGYAPTVTQGSGTDRFPATGILTITGYAPTITQPQSANPSTGTLTITGYPPTITQEPPAPPPTSNPNMRLQKRRRSCR